MGYRRDGARHTAQDLGQYTLLANAKYAYDYLHYLSDPRLDVTTMYVNNHYHQQEGYLSTAHQLSLGDDWRVALASDVQYNSLTADLYAFAYPTRLTLLTAAAADYSHGGLKAQASLLHTYVHDWTKAKDGQAPREERVDTHPHRQLQAPESARPQPARLLQADLPHADLQRPVLYLHRE